MLRQAERPGVTGWRNRVVVSALRTWRGRVGPTTVVSGQAAREQELKRVENRCRSDVWMTFAISLSCNSMRCAR